jgi:hypothetical protein
MAPPDKTHLLDIALKYIIWYGIFHTENSEDKKIPNPSSLSDEFMKIRLEAFSDREAILQYIKINPDNLNETDQALSNFLIHSIPGRFIITSVLKDHMLFLYTDPDNTNYLLKVYPQSLDILFQLKMVGLPRLGDTILFPFNDQIIYDSLSVLSISFGGGYKKSISSDVKEAKAKFGLITTLPIPRINEDKDLLLLKGYIASKQSVNENWNYIYEIIKRKPEYRSLFYQRLGEIYSRERKKELKNEGIESGWFAMLGYKVISGGKTREAVEEAVLGIIPEDKKDCLYFFNINEKKKKK